jgi:hypothetical protein
MYRGWCIVKTHPWNMLGKWDLHLLFHPWKFDLFDRFDCMIARWFKSVFNSFESFKVCIIFGVLDSVDCFPQLVECIDNGIRWCDRGLSDMLLLEKTMSASRFACVFLQNTTCIL